MASSRIDVSNAFFTLPEVSDPNRNYQPLNSSTIGAIYTVAPSQILSITTAFSEPKGILLVNMGSVSLTVSGSQNPYPRGLKLPGGQIVRLVTSTDLYIAAPPTGQLSVPLAPSLAYIGVTIEQ